jgi:hypothetical protein
MRQNVLFCSLSGNPNSIPPKAMDYMSPVPFLLQDSTSKEVAHDLDFLEGPTWYNLREHWLRWVPTTEVPPLVDDPVGFLFSAEPPELEEEMADVYYSSDEGGNPQPTFAGYYIPNNWASTVSSVAHWLPA